MKTTITITTDDTYHSIKEIKGHINNLFFHICALPSADKTILFIGVNEKKTIAPDDFPSFTANQILNALNWLALNINNIKPNPRLCT